MAIETGLTPKNQQQIGYGLMASTAFYAFVPVFHRSAGFAASIAVITVIIFIIGLLIRINKPSTYSRMAVSALISLILIATALNLSQVTVGQAHRYVELQHSSSTSTATILAVQSVSVRSNIKSVDHPGYQITYQFNTDSGNFTGTATISSVTNSTDYQMIANGGRSITIRYVPNQPAVSAPESSLHE